MLDSTERVMAAQGCRRQPARHGDSALGTLQLRRAIPTAALQLLWAGQQLAACVFNLHGSVFCSGRLGCSAGLCVCACSI